MRLRDVRHDLAAGLAVAAVAVPLSIANARLAGLDPAVGLYGSILPLVAYAVFGSSPQLIIGPTAAIAALVAAGIAPLAHADPHLYHALAITLAFLTGLVCLVASRLRLGFLADFLSHPILVGYLNGIALTIGLGQLATMLGIPIESSRTLGGLLELVRSIAHAHLPTFAIGLGTLGLITLAGRLVPRAPAALLALVAAALAVRVLHLEHADVATLGLIAGGFPRIEIPRVPLDVLPVLLAEAAGLALVTFALTMIAVRSFAARGGYEIDANREIAALGLTQIAAAIGQGFAVSGTNTRTAVAVAAGARTRLAGLCVAIVLGLVVLFLTEPLRYVPIASIAAVLVMASLRLFQWAPLAEVRRLDRHEFTLAIIAMLAAATLGAMYAIPLVIVAALGHFVWRSSRPTVEVVSNDAGVLRLRVDGPIVFFSAAHVRRTALAAADRAGPELAWFVLEMPPVASVDVTGLHALQEVFDALRARNVIPAVAGRYEEWHAWATRRGLSDPLDGVRWLEAQRERSSLPHLSAPCH